MANDINVTINNELISHIKNYECLWLKEKYTNYDELIWDEIADDMGLQKSYLKQKWHQIQRNLNENENDSKASDRKSTFLKKLNNWRRNFNSTASATSTDEEETEFDIDENTLNEEIDSEQNAFIEFDMAEEDEEIYEDVPQPIPKNILNKAFQPKQVETKREPVQRAQVAVSVPVAAPPAENKTEDQIFGEFVAKMLAQMPADRRKETKKQIMDILL